MLHRPYCLEHCDPSFRIVFAPRDGHKPISRRQLNIRLHGVPLHHFRLFFDASKTFKRAIVLVHGNEPKFVGHSILSA